MALASTVGSVLGQLDRRRHYADLASLSDLEPDEIEFARRALSAVSPRSKIDVSLLIDTVKRDVADRRRAERERRRAEASPFAYELTLMSLPQLETIRERLRAGDPLPAAMAAGRKIQIDGGARASDAVDGGGADIAGQAHPAPPPRSRSRPVPRLRPRRRPPGTATEAVSAAGRAQPSATIGEAASAPLSRPGLMRPGPLGPKLFGAGSDRPYGCPDDAVAPAREAAVGAGGRLRR